MVGAGAVAGQGEGGVGVGEGAPARVGKSAAGGLYVEMGGARCRMPRAPRPSIPVALMS